MTLRLITGRANTGKTDALYHVVRSASSGGGSSSILLPSAADVYRTREELAQSAAVGVEIATLDAWAQHQWILHGDGRRFIGPVARLTACARVSRGARGPIAGLADSRGLAGLLGTIVSRVAGEILTPDDGVVEAELARLVGEYFGLLRERGFVEPAEAMRQVAGNKDIRGGVIAVNRFTDLSRAQEGMLLGLSELNDVVIALGWEDGHAPTEALSDLVKRMMLVGAEHEHLSTSRSPDELSAVEEHLYSASDPIEPQGAVVLGEAAGDEAEAALVAHVVADLIRKGHAPCEIAVCFRDLAGRRRLITAAFAARGIETQVDVAVPFRSVPLGVALAQVLSVSAHVAGHDEMLSFLRGPFSGADTRAVDEYDRWCRAKRIVAPATMLTEAMALGGPVRRALISARGVIGVAGTELCPEKWADLVNALLANCGLEQDGDPGDSRMDAKAASLVLEAVDEVRQIGGADPLSLLNALSEVPVSSGSGEDAGVVQVTEAHRLRSRRFGAIVIGGLTASEFSSEKPEPLAVSWLSRLGAVSGTEERLSERLLFYSIVTRARERLALVRQASTSDGDAVRASIFYDEIVDLYRSADDAAQDRAGALRPSYALSLSQLAMAAPTFGVRRHNLRQEAVDRRLVPPKLRRGETECAAGVLGADDEVSVSDVEAYHACPYRWFFDRVVRPKALDRAYDSRARGSHAHGVLAAFYGEFAKTADRVTPELLEDALELLERVLIEQSQSVRLVGLSERLFATSTHEWTRQAIVQDATAFSGFVPLAHEWSFGRAAGRPFAFADIAIGGKVDRIDACPDSLFVTDYKSTPNVKGYGSFESHGLLQALIYAEAASALLEKPAAGSLYRSLRSGELRGYWNMEVHDAPDGVKDVLVQADVAELTEWARLAVTEAVEGMRAGRIEQAPRFKSACAWCSAAAFCKAVAR